MAGGGEYVCLGCDLHTKGKVQLLTVRVHVERMATRSLCVSVECRAWLAGELIEMS